MLTSSTEGSEGNEEKTGGGFDAGFTPLPAVGSSLELHAEPSNGQNK
jgi:hypothetical protein